MSTRQQSSTDQAGCSQVNETCSQERIVHVVLDDWMNFPAEREQQYAGLVGPHDRVFTVRINDGGITATAVVAYLTRDDRLELLQAYCDWPPQGQQRELGEKRQLTLA